MTVEDFVAVLLWLGLLAFAIYMLGWGMNLWWILGW